MYRYHVLVIFEDGKRDCATGHVLGTNIFDALENLEVLLRRDVKDYERVLSLMIDEEP